MGECFFIILRISSGGAEEGPEDKDGSVIGYTHKGGEMIVVLRAGGFQKRKHFER